MVSNTAEFRAAGRSGHGVLKASAITWFTIAALGQFAFAAYIFAFYGGNALEGDLDAWTRRLIVGIVDGDFAGNLNVLAHMLLAFIICVGGPLQFIPSIRKNFARFHRWNGRVFTVTAVLISLGGLYMTWARGMAGLFNEISISINAVLIIIFAVLVVRHALKRQFAIHHRWALRLFMVASGVWFFRVGYGFWFLATDGAMPGVGPMLNGPVDYALALGSYVLPLVVLELYLRTRDMGNAGLRYGVAGLVFGAAGVTGMGVVGAAMLFWLPSLAA